MAALHRTLLDSAIEQSSGWANRLQGRSILVTGASGFLASSLLAFLYQLDQSYKLGLTLYASARRPATEVPLFDFLDVPAPEAWEIAPVESTTIPDAAPLTVVHTASYGSPRDYMSNPLATYESNTHGLANLFKASAEKDVSQMVYFSSAEIYGQPGDANIPTPEDYIGGLSTTDARSIYGESKRMSEVLGTIYSQQTKIPLTLIRPWNLYGPGQRPGDGRVPVEFVRQAMDEGGIRLLSNGSPRRAFCYAWDGVAQIARLLDGDESSGAWNVGNDESEVSILDTARCCVAKCGLPDDALQFDPTANAPGMQRCCPNVNKVRSKMSDTPTPFTSLETGVETVVQWLRFLKEQR